MIRAAGVAAVVLAIATLSGCVTPPITVEPPASPLPSEAVEYAEVARRGAEVSIDLPPEWNDLTYEYLAARSESVLHGYYTTGEDVGSGAPFATTSVHAIGAGADLDGILDDDVTDWQDTLASATVGPEGYLETAAGGVVRWRDVIGDERIVRVVQVLHGPYYLYMLIDAEATETAAIESLTGALATVKFDGPVALDGRAGPPPVVDGRWVSYCEGLTGEVQEGWRYEFIPAIDSTPVDCPASSDLLGLWNVGTVEAPVRVDAQYFAGATIDQNLENNGVPRVVGEVTETPNGYLIELIEERTFERADGTPVVDLDIVTTTPEGTAVPMRYLGFDVDTGCVEVLARADGEPQGAQEAWLEDFVRSLEVANPA